MSTYAIGDVQGCLAALVKLLQKIKFDSDKDTLWFTGDLVNRGPQSLEVLRYIKNLGDQHIIVLGNHDMHLLARAHGSHEGWEEDTLQEILQAPDCDELIDWLKQKKLFHYDEKLNFALVHAGLAPSWNLATAKKLANEVGAVIKNPVTAKSFFENMYGNEPSQWSDALTGMDRLRCITNYFTRARFCHADGRLELNKKGKTDKDLVPWFRLPHRVNKDLNIIFGHWAALGGVTDTPNVYALDTGCVWGYCLTAMRLEDEARFSVECDQYARF